MQKSSEEKIFPEEFIRDALCNRHNQLILERLPSLGLPDAWLVAGCLFQTVWNLRAGQPPEAQIKDYDIFYFDDADLSAQAEAAINERVSACFAGQGITLEAKNQARVHTWYEDYFGFPYPALHCAQDGIDRFLVACTCVGLRLNPHIDSPCGPGIELYAPNGLADLYEGVLRPNTLCPGLPLFDQKARMYQARWNWLEIRC